MADAALGTPRGAAVARRGRVGELVAVLRLRGLPVHGLGRHLLGQQRARFFAEAREVGFAGQPRFQSGSFRRHRRRRRSTAS